MEEYKKRGLPGETKYDYNKRVLEDKLEESKEVEPRYLKYAYIAGGLAGWLFGGLAFDTLAEMTGRMAEDIVFYRTSASMLAFGIMAEACWEATLRSIDDYRKDLRNWYYYPGMFDKSFPDDEELQART